MSQLLQKIANNKKLFKPVIYGIKGTSLNDEEKYLVHVCLEGPEAGVYYRGEGKIINDKSVTIFLPDYVENLATNLTVQITPIYNENEDPSNILRVSRVANNQFQVFGKNAEFFWIVHGKRGKDFKVEPLKSETEVKGSGPYKWVENS